mgnify:CR=1 FL=1
MCIRDRDNGVDIDNEDALNLKSIKECVDYLISKVTVYSNNGTHIIIDIPRGDL